MTRMEKILTDTLTEALGILAEQTRRVTRLTAELGLLRQVVEELGENAANGFAVVMEVDRQQDDELRRLRDEVRNTSGQVSEMRGE